MESMSRHDIGDIMAPYTVRQSGIARLNVNGAVREYEGPILVQRRAQVFEDGERLNTFDWDQLVQAQHRLWRHGIGFLNRREVLGPHSWGVLDGRLCLVDTSGLTTDRQRVRQKLSEQNLELGQQRATQQLRRTGTDDGAEEYFRYLRQHINQPVFDQLWQSDLAA